MVKIFVACSIILDIHKHLMKNPGNNIKNVWIYLKMVYWIIKRLYNSTFW